MTIIFILVLILYVILCGVLVSLVLMQEGKGGGLTGTMGASMGETFGFGGASKQVRKYTAYCAAAFLIMTIILTFVAEAAFRGVESDFVGTDAPTATTVPATTQPGQPAAGTDAAPAIPPATEPIETNAPADAAPAVAPDSIPATAPAE